MSPGDGPAGPAECATESLLFESSLFTEGVDGARSLSTADLDGDGDNDVILAASNADTFSWYENDGQIPPSFTEHFIASVNGAWKTFPIDLNGDDDVDVIASATSDNLLLWYESDGGAPPTFTEHVIDNDLDSARSPFGIDMNNDGDIDVVAAAFDDDTVAWYESDGADPPNFVQHVITTNANGVESVFAIDLDGDNDVDVLSASNNDNTFAWYESDGADPPGFTEHILTESASGAWDILGIDLDGDADIDILTSALLNDEIGWYENDGAKPPTFTFHLVGDGDTSVSAADLDADGDIDVLSTFSNDGVVAWHENDGLTPPGFTEHLIATEMNDPRDVLAVDLDGDSDLDVLATDAFQDNVVWLQNDGLPPLGVCCLADGTCLDDMCVSDCAALLGWAWTEDATCAEVVCPGGDSPALFLVEDLDFDNFKQVVEDLAAFGTRYWDRPGNDEAVAYLADKLKSFGYDNVVLDPFEFGGVTQFNVYATKLGTKRPTEMYILGAHLDSFNKNNDLDDAPGADDDASGCASVLELARVFANVQTDVSIRFALWNNEETGLNGSSGYVESHRDLQGTIDEPTWLGMIQQDMIMFDHGPAKIPDADVEYQALAQDGGRAAIFASFVAGAMDRYGDMPAEVGDNMDFTDSVPFQTETASISVRENQRVAEIGNGSNPHWHHPTDTPKTYTDEDYEFGFNITKMITGAIGELTNAAPIDCPEDLDGDGNVGTGDLILLLGAWGTDPGGPPDFDGDGNVGTSDLIELLGSWGPCPK